MAGLGLSISPGFLLIAAFLYFAGGWTAVTAFFSAMLAHELGHLAAMTLTGAEVCRIRFGAAGPVIEFAGDLSRRQEMAVTTAGPLAGIVFAVACFVADTPYFCYAGLISLFAAAFNLLPVYPMDGGRFSYLLLCGCMSAPTAERLLRVMGTICGVCVVVSGVFLRSAAAAAAGIWMTALANVPELR